MLRASFATYEATTTTSAGATLREITKFPVLNAPYDMSNEGYVLQKAVSSIDRKKSFTVRLSSLFSIEFRLKLCIKQIPAERPIFRTLSN